MTTRFHVVFSESRINSYASPLHHDLNLNFISELTKPIAVIELVLRNRIDNIMQKSNFGKEWMLELYNFLESEKDLFVQQDHKATIHEKLDKAINLFYKKSNNAMFPLKPENNFSNDKILSKMSFGFWASIIFLILEPAEKPDIYKDILNVERINFEKYAKRNTRIFDNNLKLKFVVSLLRIIRNRAFHWENLLKTSKIQKNGRKLPGIFSKIENFTIGIYPDRIKHFINDILECFEEEILRDYKAPF